MKKFLTLIMVLTLALVTLTPAFAADNALVLISNDGSTGWKAKETGDLLPMHVSIGDVEVNGIVKYDEGGIGEDTVVINLSDKNVEVYAEYGAGEQTIINANINLVELKKQLALQEFSRIEENKSGQYVFSFTSLRFVVVDKNGKMLKDDFVAREDFFNLD